MKKLFYIILIIGSLVACKKEEVPFYSGPDGITIYLDTYDTDSLNYSFAFQPLGTEVDTIYLQMRILGATKGYDRKIRVVAGDGTTAQEGVDFKLLEGVMPADSLTISYPVVIYNTEGILEQAKKIVVAVAANDDFVPGATRLETAGTRVCDHYKIWISNRVDKPDYWSDIEYYFGEYSETKFRFMISTLGITDFSYENIGAVGLYNYPLQLNNALEVYKQENQGEPLEDEEGEVVTFP